MYLMHLLEDQAVEEQLQMVMQHDIPILNAVLLKLADQPELPLLRTKTTPPQKKKRRRRQRIVLSLMVNVVQKRRRMD